MSQLSTIWKGCLRFSTFMFLISPNLAKYTYGRSALEQYHKIEKRKKHWFHPTKYYTMDNPCFPHIRLPSMSLSLYKNKILTFLSYFSQCLVEMRRLFCFERSQRRDSIPFSWNQNKSFGMLVGITFHFRIFLALLFFFYLICITPHKLVI